MKNIRPSTTRLIVRHQDFWLAVLVLSGATLSLPLTFWGRNAWDLTAPQDVLMTGMAELLVAVTLLVIACATLKVPPLPSGVLLGSIFFILFNWNRIGLLSPEIWLLASVVVVLALDRYSSDGILRGVTAVLIAVLLVAPMLQLVLAHIEDRTTYPIARSTTPTRPSASGNVEDVVVLVTDSYPMPLVADELFDHDITILKDGLTDLGYTVPDVSWSQNTFTSLAIPSMLELRQVIDGGPEDGWRNRKARYDVARGDSFVVAGFQGAGFQYTHIEGGWNGTVCGKPDNCVETSWYDGAQSILLSTSLFGRSIDEALGPPSVSTSLRTMKQLRELEVLQDGELDYVFAHIMLPHAPFVVDAKCSVRDHEELNPPRTTRVRQQLMCVDELILETVASMPPSTAVLIAGDHGPATNGQIAKDVSEWDDTDIAERLGTLVAFKIPSSCIAPTSNTNVSAMRAITRCALNIELPPSEERFFLGEGSPMKLKPAEIAAIEGRLRSGILEQD